jgi:hypothetical protein
VLGLARLHEAVVVTLLGGGRGNRFGGLAPAAGQGEDSHAFVLIRPNAMALDQSLLAKGANVFPHANSVAGTAEALKILLPNDPEATDIPQAVDLGLAEAIHGAANVHRVPQVTLRQFALDRDRVAIESRSSRQTTASLGRRFCTCLSSASLLWSCSSERPRSSSISISSPRLTALQPMETGGDTNLKEGGRCFRLAERPRRGKLWKPTD